MSVDVFNQVLELVRNLHSDDNHRVVIGECKSCKEYLIGLRREPERLGLGEWPPNTIDLVESVIRDDVMTEIGATVEVKEVMGCAPAPRMSAVVRDGVWSYRNVIECDFRGGSIMSVETAKMLRAALDLAIEHATKGR